MPAADEHEAEFVLLSADTQAGRGTAQQQQPSSNSAPAAPPSVDRGFLSVWADLTLLGSVVAVSKQLFSSPAEVQIPSERTPKWVADRYRMQSIWRGKLLGAAIDTARLSAAPLLYAASFRLSQWVRGHDDDVVNSSLGGATAAAWIAATVFGPVRMGRVVASAAVGAWLCGYLIKERQLTEQELLVEQQALERDLLKTPEGELSRQLDIPKLRELVAMKKRQLREGRQQEAHRRQQEALRSEGRGPQGAQPGTSGAGGVSGAGAATTGGGRGGDGAGAGSSGGGDGGAGVGDEGGEGGGRREADSWMGLLASAPWLPSTGGDGGGVAAEAGVGEGVGEGGGEGASESRVPLWVRQRQVMLDRMREQRQMQQDEEHNPRPKAEYR